MLSPGRGPPRADQAGGPWVSRWGSGAVCQDRACFVSTDLWPREAGLGTRALRQDGHSVRAPMEPLGSSPVSRTFRSVRQAAGRCGLCVSGRTSFLSGPGYPSSHVPGEAAEEAPRDLSLEATCCLDAVH